jgi:hypothetical protein
MHTYKCGKVIPGTFKNANKLSEGTHFSIHPNIKHLLVFQTRTNSYKAKKITCNCAQVFV